jgi:hypothetical protein
MTTMAAPSGVAVYAPAPAAGDRTADDVGAQLVEETAHVLAELMVIGVLEHADHPAQIPGLLLPQLPAGPERDRAMFVLGAVVGAAAGRRHTRASRASVAAARTALQEAGFEAMGRLTDPRARHRPWAAP